MPTATTARLKAAGQALLFVLACEAVGLLAGLATQSSVETWYRTLDKPFFTPPGWLFAPVWMLLYALMGVAAYLVWRLGTERRSVRTALAAFAGQLALNGAWSLVFFGLQSIGGALVVILLLLAMLMFTAWLFGSLSRPAGGLLVPYLLWVAYATALNAGIFVLN